jgi:hypothetical protein
VLVTEGEHATFSSVVVGSAEPYFARVVEGAGRLVASALAYPLPLLPLVLLVFALPLWRGFRAPRPGPDDPARPGAAFLAWTIAISLALHVALVVAFGAREFHERLMQPPLFILPILIFMLIERGRPAARAVSAFAIVLAVLVAGTLAARVVVYALGADHCGSCRNMAPFGALADELRAAGYSGAGTIVANGFHVGGNMRVEFPSARVTEPSFPQYAWPPAEGDGTCLLVWQVRDDRPMSDEVGYLESYLAEKLGGSVDAPHRDGVVSAPMFGSGTRQYQLGYRLYDEPTGDCR